MLTFGYDFSTIPSTPGVVVLNLSSYIEGYQRWNILPPFEVITNQREFDIAYGNYLMQNVFVEFMKPIMALYMGMDVHILVNQYSEHAESVTESIMKFIQQRYGYVSNILNDPEDLQYATEGEFSINGLYNLDMDKEKFSYLTVDVETELSQS